VKSGGLADSLSKKKDKRGLWFKAKRLVLITSLSTEAHVGSVTLIGNLQAKWRG
jgi:hypothetical protein